QRRGAYQHAERVQPHVPALPQSGYAAHQPDWRRRSGYATVEDVAVQNRQALGDALQRPSESGAVDGVEPEAVAQQRGRRPGAEAFSELAFVDDVHPVACAEPGSGSHYRTDDQQPLRTTRQVRERSSACVGPDEYRLEPL